jgi:chitin disaccharide deacetylase
VATPRLLIVNADDWGGMREATEAIDTCFVSGAISSATAMVHMADSRRAAEVARERERPIGLHLNLTQVLESAETPPAVRERQRQACAYFADLKRRRWQFSPDVRVHRLVADCIRDQLEEFWERYGCEPTHVDSHHHVHVCFDVLLSGAMTSGARVRQTLSPAPSAGKVSASRLARRAKHELLARRFVTTARFWRARELQGGEGAVPIAEAAAYSLNRPVEMMVHPSFQADLAVLRSDAWLEVLERAPLGPYSSLPARPWPSGGATPSE